jgi:hypothetical protein
MINKEVSMLLKAVEYISSAESITKQEAFCKLLDWCAVKIGIEGVHSSMKYTTSDKLKELIDLELLKKTTNDWFGLVYESVFNTQIKSLDECIKTIESHKIIETDGFPKSILFQTAETGRLILASYIKHDDSLLLYGLETDLLKYHIALVNIRLFNLPAFVINIDEQEGKDFTTSSENWKLSNYWNTPKAKWFN